MRVTIKRQDTPQSAPYWQTFVYEPEERTTAAAVLDWLNRHDDLTDESGRPAGRIRWECSCLEKKCGACAMLINHRPRLACAFFLEPAQMPELTLEPLSKFPVLRDLCVDRSCIHESLIQARAWLGEYGGSRQKEFRQQYDAAKCLKCGLCLEACPNYTGTGSFYGAVWANEAYLLKTSSADRRKELTRAYRAHFESGCSKVLACVEVCPMKISTLSSMGYMNRLL